MSSKKPTQSTLSNRQTLDDSALATVTDETDATDQLDLPANSKPTVCAAVSEADDGHVAIAAELAPDPCLETLSGPTKALTDGVANAAETDERSGDHLPAREATAAVAALEYGGTQHVDVNVARAAESDEGLTEQSVAPSPALPDPADISARLRTLVVSVSRVEELSRHARELAASDLAMYEGITASLHQFEDGLAEATRIHDEAQAVYHRAFGREAKEVAEPAVAEAREIQTAFQELSIAWSVQATTFIAEHPDVEALLAEQQERHEQASRHEAARARVQRFQDMVASAEAALRQGQLGDARDTLGQLGREFPAEASRIAPIQERLEHRVRAANDATARAVLIRASELQGRGEFEAAVKELERVDVFGLSREVSEDVFGRWSSACSLLAQTGAGLELVRYSPAQGRGLILTSDPSVPYGLLVFSSLGMGANYPEGRVVSKSDRDGRIIVERARGFRQAQPLPELDDRAWYGRSYATVATAAATPVRH